MREYYISVLTKTIETVGLNKENWAVEEDRILYATKSIEYRKPINEPVLEIKIKNGILLRIKYLEAHVWETLSNYRLELALFDENDCLIDNEQIDCGSVDIDISSSSSEFEIKYYSKELEKIWKYLSNLNELSRLIQIEKRRVELGIKEKLMNMQKEIGE